MLDLMVSDVPFHKLDIKMTSPHNSEIFNEVSQKIPK